MHKFNTSSYTTTMCAHLVSFPCLAYVFYLSISSCLLLSSACCLYTSFIAYYPQTRCDKVSRKTYIERCKGGYNHTMIIARLNEEGRKEGRQEIAADHSLMFWSFHVAVSVRPLLSTPLHPYFISLLSSNSPVTGRWVGS